MSGHDPLGPEWGTAPDGTRTRDASRVVVLDDAGRVLLVRGTDPERPGEAWWFTVGGGRGAGEAARDAAARELREETGLAVAPGDLAGPVWVRTADFPYLGRACRQREEFFVLRLGAGARLSRAGWTALELATLTDVRWWHPDELAASGDTYYPADLPALLADLPPAWSGPPRVIG
ncbi:NUDIX hydrolase [Kineococcus sp. SYSU DK004]|uniref:NUDIX hydrolase n=1 Tax=Kineococcus sp. SYSU DK004 TaxID=3383125 RepID=UPI003D7C7006